MEIRIGIGLDNIVFGMSQEDVRNILGEPDKINNSEKTDGIVYYYNEHLIKTKFDITEDYKLYSIDVYNPEVLMFNQKIINKRKNEILRLLRLNGCQKFEYDDYELFDTVFYENIYSTFMFEFDRLTSIEFSPLFDSNDELVWPTIDVLR